MMTIIVFETAMQQKQFSGDAIVVYAWLWAGHTRSFLVIYPPILLGFENFSPLNSANFSALDSVDGMNFWDPAIFPIWGSLFGFLDTWKVVTPKRHPHGWSVEAFPPNCGHHAKFSRCDIMLANVRGSKIWTLRVQILGALTFLMVPPHWVVDAINRQNLSPRCITTRNSVVL